jgi:hypothetical protein
MSLSLLFQGISAGISLLGSLNRADEAEERAETQQARIAADAAANQAVSAKDAESALREARWEEEDTRLALMEHARKVEALLSLARARQGKSGVALGEGSPLRAMELAAAEAAREAAAVSEEGERAAQRKRDLAWRYQTLGAAGLRDAAYQAALAGMEGNARASASTLSGVQTVLEYLARAAE